MDLLESLTTDFDHLRHLTIELTVAEPIDRQSVFRDLVRLHDVSSKAEMAAMRTAGATLDQIEFAKRKLLERADVMEELANAVARTQRAELRDAKMDLYADLVLQRIRDCEREILPALFDVVSENDRSAMALAYEKYKDCALDGAGQPHSA